MIAKMDLEVADVTGQKRHRVRGIPTDSTVGELVDGLLGRMNLPVSDGEGRPLCYHARLEREGRHLNRAETVGDALQSDDELTLQPDIDAG